ncbi:MAG: ribbon-helix-helix domain-containing protein, partial [Promethearchaeota archaeon]
MSSQDDNERKKPKMDRITVSLDEFDYKVITKMAQNRNIPLSEATRIAVHSWIETNPEILKRNYGVDIQDVT